MRRGKYALEVCITVFYMFGIFEIFYFFYDTISDYLNYDEFVSSVPFRTYVAANALDYLLPGVAVFSFAHLLNYFRKRRNQKKSLPK